MRILMKHKLILISILLTSPFYTFAQSDSAHAPYLMSPVIPDFSISTSPDGTLFTNHNLKKNTNTVFIMFNPDCEFCQHETRDLLRNINRFKHTQIIMASYMSQKSINEFYKKYNIANYPIIVLGRDAKFFFFKFFKLHIAPSTFIYDTKGHFKKAFHRIVDMDTLLKEL